MVQFETLDEFRYLKIRLAHKPLEAQNNFHLDKLCFAANQNRTNQLPFRQLQTI